MLEAWADLYGITGEEQHLDLIHCYERPRLFDRLLAEEDPLTLHHANTPIPEIHGAARAYEVTGDERCRRIVKAYWKCVVTQRGVFLTGGQTVEEVWTSPFKMAAYLGESNQEHCVVYNMIRLATTSSPGQATCSTAITSSATCTTGYSPSSTPKQGWLPAICHSMIKRICCMCRAWLFTHSLAIGSYHARTSIAPFTGNRLKRRVALTNLTLPGIFPAIRLRLTERL